MICIDKKLIVEELKNDIDDGFIFSYKKLSNKFLDWLFRHYYCVEQCVNSYDSEPLDYDEWKALQKTPEGRSELAQVYKDYEYERIKFCNWQEPSFKGNWGMTQAKVDKWARVSLEKVKDIPTSKKDRIYYSKKDDEIRIYIYTRDIKKEDIWFIFSRR